MGGSSSRQVLTWGGGGGKNSQKFADVICEQSLIALFCAKIKIPKFGTKNALLG